MIYFPVDKYLQCTAYTDSHSVYRLLYTTMYTVLHNSTPYTVYIVQYTLYGMYCAMYIVHCTMYGVIHVL